MQCRVSLRTDAAVHPVYDLPTAYMSSSFMPSAQTVIVGFAQGRLDIDTQCRGFLELAKEAVGHLVNAIYADAAFADLFHKLYCSEEWQGGVTTASILATLGDYFEDYETLLEPSWFKRCAPLPSPPRRGL
jgi:hypothetical protein